MRGIKENVSPGGKCPERRSFLTFFIWISGLLRSDSVFSGGKAGAPGGARFYISFWCIRQSCTSMAILNVMASSNFRISSPVVFCSRSSLYTSVFR